jgi:hypothetical protein
VRRSPPSELDLQTVCVCVCACVCVCVCVRVYVCVCVCVDAPHQAQRTHMMLMRAPAWGAAFRVVRLFGRLQSIRKIIVAIGRSILPVRYLNPKPETLNPKPETLNPKPETLNPKL